jgi:hypothetical protein
MRLLLLLCRGARARQLQHCHDSTAVLWLEEKRSKAPWCYCLNTAHLMALIISARQLGREAACYRYRRCKAEDESSSLTVFGSLY